MAHDNAASVPDPDGFLPQVAGEGEHDGIPGSARTTVLAGIVTGVVAIGFAAGSIVLGPGTMARPGAGAWPLLCAIAVLVGSVYMIVRARHLPLPEKFSWYFGLVLVVAAATALWGVVLPYTGFEIPTLVLMFAWVKFLGRKSWLFSILASVIASTAFYLLFVVALRIDLPRLIAF